VFVGQWMDGSIEVSLADITVRAATPLCFVDVHIRVHKDVLGRSGGSDGIPDFEASRVLGPAGVLLNDLLGDLGSVGVAQGIDHGDFERNVHALTVVYLIDHLDRVGPALV
jgi:hypothetical protein